MSRPAASAAGGSPPSSTTSTAAAAPAPATRTAPAPEPIKAPATRTAPAPEPIKAPATRSAPAPEPIKAPATRSAPAPEPIKAPAASTAPAPAPAVRTATAANSAGFPDASNTGYKNAVCPNGLTTWGGGAIKSNTTYSCIDFPGGANIGSASADVTNVTMYGDNFHGAAPEAKLVGVWGTGISFSYCTFAPGTTTLPTPFAQSYQYGISADGSYYTHVGALNVDHSDFYGFGNAIDTTGSTQAAPQVFTDNWIHDAATGGDYHVDGIGTESGSGTGSYVVIKHNTISSEGNTNGLAFQAGHYDHFTITGNQFSGFGYTVAILGGATNVTFTGNTFSTLIKPDWGPVYPADFANTAGSTWSGNRWSVPAGAAWGDPAHNGWFWLPTAGSGSSDTAYVSQTDYTG